MAESRGRIKMIIKEENNFYNKKIKPFANDNRKQMTKAEACLWKYALRNKMLGVTFNRQRPVMNYIADFMCKDLKLIIEVDGFSHTFEEVIENDKIRQEHLEKNGFKVIRFLDNEVLTNIQQVRNKIFEVITELKTTENN